MGTRTTANTGHIKTLIRRFSLVAAGLITITFTALYSDPALKNALSGYPLFCPAPDTAKRLGFTGIRMIREATSVQVFRVDSDYDPTKDPTVDRSGIETIGGSLVIQKSPPLHGKYLTDVKSLILGDGISDPLMIGCVPDYGVILRLISPNGSMDVELCFHCNQVGILETDTKGQSIGSYSGNINEKNAFLKLSQEAFPNDVHQ